MINQPEVIETMIQGRAWALEMMKHGNKVRNEYFTSDEYLHMVDGVITSEDGYNFENWFYSVSKGEEWKLTGWSIHHE